MPIYESGHFFANMAVGTKGIPRAAARCSTTARTHIPTSARAVALPHSDDNPLHSPSVPFLLPDTLFFSWLQTKDKRGQCDEREIPTIVRSLGLNPTQEQLRDIITELRGEDSMSGYVEYERFEKTMMRVLTEQQAGQAATLFVPEFMYWTRGI
jgi:hypothetical protein